MDDIYKIFAAAAVGFVLNPLSDLLKVKIGIFHSKKRLLNKLELSEVILSNAINTLNKTSTMREAFINSSDLNHQGFLLAYLKTPKLEDDFEKAYPHLSRNQIHIIEIVIHGMAHVAKLEEKSEKADEKLKEALYEIKTTCCDEIKEIHNKYYKRILSCEKAILFSLITIRKNIQLAIKDSKQNSTNLENFNSTSEELGVEFNLSWWQWPPASNEEISSGITEDERERG